MYYCYGEVRLSIGGIPAAGSDSDKAWPVFQAGENPVEIISGQYRGGDASEFYALAIAPPDFVANGTTTIAGDGQGVQLLTGTLAGGAHSPEAPGNVYHNEAAKAYQGVHWIIPPYHQVICWPYLASANFFTVILQGMDLVKP